MSAGKPSARQAASGAQPPTESELITRLRQLPAGPGPDAEFKADLRSQLVAITSRIVAESADDVRPIAPARRRSLARRFRTPVLSIVGAAAVLVLLLGAAVWMSKGALPGQSLYGVKRAGENVKLSIAGNSTDKGITYLQFATKRVNEANKLLEGSSSPSPHDASLVTDTLDSADSDSRDGMKLLGGAVASQHSAAPLAKVTAWSAAQKLLLTGVVDQAPEGALKTRAEASLSLLNKIVTRTAAWRQDASCTCLSTTRSDDLGPTPCSGGCARVPVVPSGSAPTVLPSLPGLGTGSPSPTPSTTRP